MIQYTVIAIGSVMEKGVFFPFLIPRNPERVGFVNLSTFSIPGISQKKNTACPSQEAHLP